ncbi:TonB-dependent receptor [Colwellia sp. D2M02]|nr:TonB-dependent receptor [Colwellia sp. D2M02]
MPTQAEQNTKPEKKPRYLETTIVTTELIERPLHNSANSVEIFTSDDIINKAGIVTLRDALNNTTNLTMVTGTGKAPTVRGIDGTGPAENANAFFAGSRPRLSWQIDNRPASYSEVVFGDFGLFDVERIEVLRGPQSSLVGRNAIAGTVIVKTQEPDFETAGTIQLAGGNYNQQRASGMVNIPINNNSAALRLTADWFQRDSTVSYDPYLGVNNPGDMDGLSLRGKLLLLPEFANDSRLLLSISHTDYTAPNGEIIVRPFSERRSNYPLQPTHNPKTTSIATDYSMSLASYWQLQINMSATQLDFVRHAVPNTSNATIDTREYVIEPQLSYENDNGLSAVTGLYYYRAQQDEFIEIIGGQNFDDRTDTIAAYAEGVVPLTSEVDLSLGLRLEQEKRQRHGGDISGNLVQISADNTYQVALPKAGINWQATEQTSWGLQASKGYNAGGGGITFAFPIVNYQYKEESAWTYELYGRQLFANGKITTRQNLFYSQYKDMQLPFDLTPDDSKDEAFVVRNANRVNTSGLELAVDAALTDTFDVFANLALLDTDIVNYPYSGVEGNQLLAAPNITANLGLAWHTNHWNANISARYSDEYFSDVNNRTGGKTDAYIVADAQISYEVGSIRLFAHVKNIFDTDKPVARYPGTAPRDSNQSNSAFDTAVLLQPRTFLIGVQLQY